MPEGDTIFQAAQRLGAVLTDQELLGFRAPVLRGPRPQIGETITGVEAVGKHLLIRFSGGITLETHMRMTGSWRTFAVAEPPRGWGPDARVVLDTPTVQAVCLRAPIVRTWRRPDTLAHLGPDLCHPDADIDEVLRRMEQLDQNLEIGVVLLDQRIACGVGNVYKSEVLFACRINPVTPLGKLDLEIRRALIETAARQLQANLRPGRRMTVAQGYAVYQRSGQRCRLCATPIIVRRQGNPPRSTYLCPQCQPVTDRSHTAH